MGKCKAVTKAGKACRFAASPESVGGLCIRHDPELRARVDAKRAETMGLRPKGGRRGLAGVSRLVPGFPKRLRTREQIRRAHEAIAVAVADGLMEGHERELNTLNMCLKGLVSFVGQKVAQAEEMASKSDAKVMSIEAIVRRAAKRAS